MRVAMVLSALRRETCRDPGLNPLLADQVTDANSGFSGFGFAQSPGGVPPPTIIANWHLSILLEVEAYPAPTLVGRYSSAAEPRARFYR